MTLFKCKFNLSFFAVSVKTWSDIWSMGLEDLEFILERNEMRNELKDQKIQRLCDLCQKYGVH